MVVFEPKSGAIAVVAKLDYETTLWILHSPCTGKVPNRSLSVPILSWRLLMPARVLALEMTFRETPMCENLL